MVWKVQKFQPCNCEVRLPGNPTDADFIRAHNEAHKTTGKTFVPVKAAAHDNAVELFLNELVVRA